MELTKKAEAIKQDLSLSKLADVVIDICKVIDNIRITIETKPMTFDKVTEEKRIIEISGIKDGKDVLLSPVSRKTKKN